MPLQGVCLRRGRRRPSGGAHPPRHQAPGGAGHASRRRGFTHIGEAIRLLGERLGYPREDVAELFFMETVLANVWSLEDGEIVDWERLELASRIMNGG